jgi:hypothetical protein
VDSSGNAYLTGFTESSDFPTTAGAFDTTFNGSTDVFVLKLDPTGASLVYSTFVGGSGHDGELGGDHVGGGIAVDAAGAAYVTGLTLSADFPTTGGAFDTTINSGVANFVADAFVTKVNAAGTALVYSTFLGGSADDTGHRVAVDAAGAAYVTGNTDSPDFPTTVAAFDTTISGSRDAFVTKLDPTGTSLVYSTFLGGSSYDEGMGIAVDATGAAYVAGIAGSTDFPTTAGAFDTTFNGGHGDFFVAKLDPTGTPLVYSTFLGGSGFDGNGSIFGGGITVDPTGAVYVAASTSSPDFPTTGGAFDTTFNGGGADVFMTKVHPAGTSLAYSTFLGGSDFEEGLNIAVDTLGNAYVTGITHSGDFPTTAGAFDFTFNGFNDVFVAKLATAGSTPTGTDVVVQPTDPTTGTAPVTLTFDNVTQAGTTSLTTSSAGPPPPSGLRLGTPPTYYEISTTAQFTGSVELCFNYSGTSFGNENNLKLSHFDGTGWVDVTSSLDTVNDIICGLVTSLSFLAILELDVQPEGLQPPLALFVPEGGSIIFPDKAFKQGRTLPLRLRLFAGGVALTDAHVSPPQIVVLVRSGDAIDLDTIDPDAGEANDSGVLFRYSDPNWVYNLRTKDLSSGTYVITIEMPDGLRYAAAFVLR